MNERLNFIVLCRFLACFGVTLHHLFVVGPSPVKYFQDFFTHGNTGVIMFFVISGFVIIMSLESLSLKQFIIRRILRIYPALFFVAILSLIVYLSGRSYLGFNQNYINLIPNLLLFSDFIPSGGGLFLIPHWTLIIEIKFYIICMLLVTLCSKIDLKIIMIYSILGYFISLGCIAYLKEIGDTFWVEHHTIFRNISSSSFAAKFHGVEFLQVQGAIFLVKTISYTIIMFIGTIIYLYYKERIDILTMFISTVMLLLCSNMIPYEPIMHSIKELYLPILGFILLFLNGRHLKLPKIIHFFSDISYSMYLSHNLVACTLFPSFYQQVDRSLWWPISAACITILLSWLIFRFVELPMIKFSKRLGVTE